MTQCFSLSSDSFLFGTALRFVITIPKKKMTTVRKIISKLFIILAYQPVFL